MTWEVRHRSAAHRAQRRCEVWPDRYRCGSEPSTACGEVIDVALVFDSVESVLDFRRRKEMEGSIYVGNTDEEVGRVRKDMMEGRRDGAY